LQHSFRRVSGIEDQYYKQRELDKVKAWAEKGINLPNQIANTFGLNRYELVRQMEYANAIGFTDLLKPMLNANTMQEDMEGGRPQKPAGSLTDAGAATRDSGSNRAKGGKV